MEHEMSLPYSVEPSTDLYPEPDTFSNIHFNNDFPPKSKSS
jgi:hypothetical protein